MKKLINYFGIIILILSFYNCGSSYYGNAQGWRILDAATGIASILDCTIGNCSIQGNHRHSNIWYRGRFNQYDRQPLYFEHDTYTSPRDGVQYCQRSCNVPTYRHHYENRQTIRRDYKRRTYADYIIRYSYNQRNDYYWGTMVNNRLRPNLRRGLVDFQSLRNGYTVHRTHYHRPYHQGRSGRRIPVYCNNYCH